MKQIFRLSISVLLAGVLLTFAAGVWAGPTAMSGTVPNGTICGAGGQGTVFRKWASCNPAPGAVDSSASNGEGIESTQKSYSSVYQQDVAQTVCFAYPPAYAKHNVQINIYSNGTWHPVQSEILGNPAQICAELPVGSVFALLGNQYLMR